MQLNILRRGGGLGGGGGCGGFICSLLWGSTALGMKMHDTRLDRRVPQPQPQPQNPPPPTTVWVTVTAQGGWMLTEFATTTVTPTASNLGSTSIATVTSTATTEITVTNTVTVQSTATQASAQTSTQTVAAVTGTKKVQPIIGTNSTATTTETTITDVVVIGQPAVATVTDFVAEPTTWAQGAPAVRRQVFPVTVTITTTIWDWASGTTTSTITVVALPTPDANGFLVQTSMVMLTTTLVTTQTSTFTTEKTVIASSSSAPSPTALVFDGTDPMSTQSDAAAPKTPNVEIILGASFGALIGFVGIFVLAYLWSKKRRDKNLRIESVGFSTNDFSKSAPAAGAGVMGMLGSLHRSSSTTRYNNLPTTESIPNMSPLPAPPHSPPPQLPSLRVLPPSGEFNYDYTFGSPVSSIDEAQLHALTSGGSINRMGTPPHEPPIAPDALFYTLSRQNEEPPWRTGAAVAETVATETVVSSVSSESERIGSLRRKPLPGGDLVSP